MEDKRSKHIVTVRVRKVKEKIACVTIIISAYSKLKLTQVGKLRTY